MKLYMDAMHEALNNVNGYFEESELQLKHDDTKGKSLSMVCLNIVPFRILFDRMIFDFFQLVRK